MTQQLLPESPEKTQQHVEGRETSQDSATSFQGGLQPILQLQRTLGNQRVAQLIQAKRLTPEGKIIGLQRKLTVGAADDQYEQEADRVARQVMNIPDAVVTASAEQAPSLAEAQNQTLQTKPLAASITPIVQRQREKENEVEEDQDTEEEKDESLQAKFISDSAALPLQRQMTTGEEEAEPIQAKPAGSMADSFEAGADVETQLSLSKGRGSPLPDPVRAFMEPRFGVDFSHVHVHTGSDALQMNRDVGAQAFTHGSDIYFGGCHSPSNLELTAHELTHVVQQTGGSVSRIVINRQQVPGPLVPGPDPASLGPVGGMLPTSTETATFDPTFEIVPGGLSNKAERTQQMVFRGDTLIFRAQLQNIPTGDLGIEGRVVGGSPATTTIVGNTATWRVIVGNMGTPGKPGEPAELVDAKPYLTLTPPLINAGRKFQQTYQIRVVADMAWLSSQCTTAGANLSSAFLGLSSQIDQAYLNYDEAYQLHKTAVENHGKRKQLEKDILLGILLAGVGGATGGKVASMLKDEGVMVATATGDISKYIVRLATLKAPGGTGAQGSDTPNPTASPGTAKAAGVSPERWKAIKEKECIDAAKAGVDICNSLKVKMDEAWAQGKTELMDLDPVQVVAPTVKALSSPIDVKTTKQYAIELWRTWIHTYGITAKENWAGGKTRTDELQGHTAFTDSKLFDDIHAQIADALDADIQALRVEIAPDPLTEMPD